MRDSYYLDFLRLRLLLAGAASLEEGPLGEEIHMGSEAWSYFESMGMAISLSLEIIEGLIGREEERIREESLCLE